MPVRSIPSHAGVAGAAALLAGAGFVVAACSSQTSPTQSSSRSTSASPIQALPPIFITKAESITVKVGSFLDVTTPQVTKVTTDNARVLEVSQPYSDGSATFNGGAKVIGAGQAKLRVFGGITNNEMYSVDVTATE